MSGGVWLRLLVRWDLEVIGYGYPALACSSPFRPHVSISGAKFCSSGYTVTTRSWDACSRSICKIGRVDIVVSILTRKSTAYTCI